MSKIVYVLENKEGALGVTKNVKSIVTLARHWGCKITIQTAKIGLRGKWVLEFNEYKFKKFEIFEE